MTTTEQTSRRSTVNLTSKVVVLSSNIVEDVDEAFRKARTWISETAEASISRYSDRQRRALTFFRPASLNQVECWPSFLNDLAWMVSPDSTASKLALSRLMNLTEGFGPSAATFSIVKLTARFVLQALWGSGKVILPLSYTNAHGISKVNRVALGPELLEFCLNYPELAGSSLTYRLRQHVPRWLVCTGWFKPEDIDISDALALHRFLMDASQGRIDFVDGITAPGVAVFLDACLAAFPDKVTYSKRDVELFRLYFVRRFPPSLNFQNIEAHVHQLDQQQMQEKEERAARRRAPARQSEACDPTPVAVSEFDHLVYVKRFCRQGWFADLSELSFVQKPMSAAAKATWSGLFDTYMSYRSKVRGFESGEGVKGGLNCLADYLSICIPISGYFGGLSQDVPINPKIFTRYPYVDNRGRDTTSPTLLAFVGKKYGRTSQYSHLTQVCLFFDWIVQTYGDDDGLDIAGPGFKNPIARKFDLPRTTGAKAKKTNKRPFAKYVIPHLLGWLYAVEAFGMHLASQGKTVQRIGNFLSAAEHGFVPFYRHLGRLHRVEAIPMPLLRTPPGYSGPTMTVLRMVIVALETGLRFQGVQWLCRNKFDVANRGSGHRDFYLLTVNTDKTNDGFTTPILPRTRAVLLREARAQLEAATEDQSIYYENRENTRFEKLVPLFRNIANGQPFSDGAYSDSWTEILVAFGMYFAGIGHAEFVRLQKPKQHKIERTFEGYPYARLKVQCLYTPHSCRSTFITRRSPFISLEDAARLVGHANAVVTSHYDYPEMGELGAKLLHADATIGEEAGPTARITSGPAFIKARDANSALVASFRKDRAETIKTFGMISLRQTLDASADDDTGLDLLRASPMSQVVFRETHICPVGENCPPEIVVEIGGYRRCGVCPLACKCIDHLPAIAAQQRLLLERTQSSRETYSRFSDGDGGAGALGELYDAIEADFQEYLGWRLAEEILEDMRSQSHLDPERIHVAEPEIIRRHLKRVVKPTNQVEFVLRRVVEANVYPTLATDRLRLQALKMTKRIMAGTLDAEVLIGNDELDEIAGLASLVVTVLKSRNVTLEQLSQSISQPVPRSAALRAQPAIALLGIPEAADGGA